MHIQSLRVPHIVGAPYLLNQGGARHHPPRIPQQNLKKLELFQRHRNLNTVHSHHMPLHVHPHRPSHQRRTALVLFRVPAAAAAKHSPDARNQLTRRIRFCHIVVSAQLKAQHLIKLSIFGSEHNNRHGRNRPQLFTHLKPGLPREHHIQKHQVGAFTFESGHRLQPVIHHNRREALPAQ